jgi:O-acetyl-ADP-ribose deacetylase (regulator of RNase III)
MIRIVISEATDLESEAILRSVSSGLEADTPFSRDVEVGAGSDIAQRLQDMGELPVGAAVITPGGDLPVAFLIHVVLQSADQPVTPSGLRLALQNGLRRAREWDLNTLALPALGTGAGNLDVEESASVMIPLIKRHLAEADHPQEVTIVVGTSYEAGVFSRMVEAASPPTWISEN